MLPRDWPIVIFMPGALGADIGKMGYGILRYSPNRVVCVVDPEHAGRRVGEVLGEDEKLRPDTPIVGDLNEIGADARAVVIGIAPPGGNLPESWLETLDRCVERGLSLVNGLHDPMRERYRERLRGDQFVWDLRQEPAGLGPGRGSARLLPNRRILMVGTDMAVGKMTAGLELWRELLARGKRADFLATGQIGITITGSGVALDAVRVDYACGAIEREVLRRSHAEVLVVEGQGSLVHPGSTATLPLLRGAMPTDLILCLRAGQTHLRRIPEIEIPPLDQLIPIYEGLATLAGAFPMAKCRAVAVNTAGLNDLNAATVLSEIARRTGLPAGDPVRGGAALLADAL